MVSLTDQKLPYLLHILKEKYLFFYCVQVNHMQICQWTMIQSQSKKKIYVLENNVNLMLMHMKIRLKSRLYLFKIN